MGREAGYTEAMVKGSALILSGWTVDYGQQLRCRRTSLAKHTTGPGQGARLQRPQLGPRTAVPSPSATCATWPTIRPPPSGSPRKLALRFVSSHSVGGLRRPAGRRRSSRSGTDIKATLRCAGGLAASSRARRQGLVRSGPRRHDRHDPGTGHRRHRHRGPTRWPSCCPPCAARPSTTWPRPDGPPRSADAFCTPGRMLCSANAHWQLVRGDSIDRRALPGDHAAGCPRRVCGSTRTSTTSAARSSGRQSTAQLLRGVRRRHWCLAGHPDHQDPHGGDVALRVRGRGPPRLPPTHEPVMPMNDSRSPARSSTGSADSPAASMLKGVLAAGAGIDHEPGRSATAFRQTAFAATSTNGTSSWCCRLRGGVDGLGLVVPHGDPAYYTARPDVRAARRPP